MVTYFIFHSDGSERLILNDFSIKKSLIYGDIF